MSIHTRKLPWPMSHVERDVLHSLWLESQRTGQHLKAQAEKQAVQRRARPQAIDLARLVQPRGGAR